MPSGLALYEHIACWRGGSGATLASLSMAPRPSKGERLFGRGLGRLPSMPPTMSFSPAAFRSPRSGIESGNSLGCRPVVRQSKLYREKESGNTMKGIFGQDHLSWKTNEQQGAFAGHGVFDAASGSTSHAGPAQPQATGAAPATAMEHAAYPPAAMAGSVSGEVEYPLPGSVASCDACGEVVNRFYHCEDCCEATGLFDLCVECCAATYLNQGTPRALAHAAQLPSHPTHKFATHRMVHITPPDGR
jgi:hypothetical protein